MVLPVCGLRPVRAGRSPTFSLPMPGRVISSLFSRESLTISPSWSSTARTAALVVSVASAMSEISWSLVIAMV
ncbi:hypothetical protein D3C84_805000 [compost metagenome]